MLRYRIGTTRGEVRACCRAATAVIAASANEAGAQMRASAGLGDAAFIALPTTSNPAIRQVARWWPLRTRAAAPIQTPAEVALATRSRVGRTPAPPAPPQERCPQGAPAASAA